MKDLHLLPFPYPVHSGKNEALLFTYYGGEPDFLFHYHPEYELTLTLGSMGRRLVGNGVANYAEKDLVLLGPNLPHTWAAEPQRDRALPWENYTIHFTRESLGLDFLSRRELKEISALLDRASRGLVFHGAGRDAAAALMRRAAKMTGARRLVVFLSVLQRLASAQAEPLVSSTYAAPNVERDHLVLAGVLEYIHRHSESQIRLREIAAHASMSIPTFCRFFRRATGRSLVDYVNDWRISRAGTMLAGTTYSILEISERVGFNNLSHFNRQFLRRRGVTPREFRKRQGRG